MIVISLDTAKLALQALAELPIKVAGDAFNEIMNAVRAELTPPAPPAA